MNHNFKVDLQGMIDLLSNHLYSGPQVFLRELLQNAVDAIRARQQFEPDHRGSVRIEVPGRRGKGPPTLAIVDDGIGLTEEEVHQFLATIGQTSKRGGAWERPEDFIGRFGIGLLSCFLVSGEIALVTRSIHADSPAIEWRGRPDGTYTVRTFASEIANGTTHVYLTARRGCEDEFEPDRVREMARHYGGLLPYPIVVVEGSSEWPVNLEEVPWRHHHATRDAEAQARLDFGRRLLDGDFLDVIPLHSEAGGVDGVAYVLKHSPGVSSKRTHRVYLKDMLLSEAAEGLLPDWAFFVKCIVNARDLRPTASREAFYEDEALVSAREALGQALRDYLFSLASTDPTRLRRLIGLHELSIKALAVEDDEAYRVFVDWLPFETSMGTMALGEYRRKYEVVQYIPNLDQFRQVARAAAAQSICVINGAYTYNEELLARLPEVFPGTRVEALDASALVQAFENLTLVEQEHVYGLLHAADLVLQPFHCVADAKKFLPEDLPVLYSTDPDAHFLRSIEQAHDVADPLWSSVLGNLEGRTSAAPYARLCFNARNALVRKIAGLKDQALLRRLVQMLYVQALLMGHHPLGSKEMALLNEGLTDLIERGVSLSEGGA